MTWKISASIGAALLLLGCIEIQNIDNSDGGVRIAPAENFIDVPEQVRASVSPSQDLSAVKIDPVDGCYVYQYVGPVEVTFLPLLTREGRMICTPKEETPEAVAAS